MASVSRRYAKAPAGGGNGRSGNCSPGLIQANRRAPLSSSAASVTGCMRLPNSRTAAGGKRIGAANCIMNPPCSSSSSLSISPRMPGNE
eukprot:1467073-Prymnesium_polylepis.1